MTSQFTITHGYKGNMFLKDQEGTRYLMSSYNQKEPWRVLSNRECNKYIKFLSQVQTLHDPLIEIGRTFSEIESAKVYILAVDALEDLLGMKATINEHSMAENGPINERKKAIKEKGYNAILQTIKPVQERGLLEILEE